MWSMIAPSTGDGVNGNPGVTATKPVGKAPREGPEFANYRDRKMAEESARGVEKSFESAR